MVKQCLYNKYYFIGIYILLYSIHSEIQYSPNWCKNVVISRVTLSTSKNPTFCVWNGSYGKYACPLLSLAIISKTKVLIDKFESLSFCTLE